jgi:hypothetical protein
MIAIRARVAAVSAIAMLSAVACSVEQASDPYSQPVQGVAADAGPPPSVEELAAKAGCKPKIQIEAADLRQGYCKTSIGKFFLTTFTTEHGKDEWMDQAPEYNPHLVGNIWTALGPRAVLDKLRVKIGGDLHLKDHRSTEYTPDAPVAG